MTLIKRGAVKVLSKEKLSYEEILIKQRLIKFLLSVRERCFIQIVQKTLVSIFPFLLLVTIVVVFSEAVFNERGYLNRLFDISDLLPGFRLLERTISNFAVLLAGLTSPITCYFAAKYTARSYGCNSGTVGITALIFNLIINSQELFTMQINDGALTRINLPVSFNLFLTICTGYLIGQIFRLSSHKDDQIVDENYVYRPRSILPVFICLVIAIILSLIFTIGNKYNVFSIIETYINGFLTVSSDILQSFINTFTRSISAWIGNSKPYHETGFESDTNAIANLNAALTSKGSGNIPHLFSDTNLYAAYGGVAGLGGTLALIVAIICKSSNQKNKNIAIRCIFPSMFNQGTATMVGIPVSFNIIYLVPFIIAPLINVLIAAVLLYFKVIPPAVYPVPSGTPSILYAFVGTAGSVRALVVAIILFTVDIIIYIPFVKLDDYLHSIMLNNGVKGGNDGEKE